ncbi:hypothetical protein OH720_17920 [Pseudomonas sp. WJP1]|uniref:hypothetical protein n=1 Tax=Pseudomonas sp. WJP1 TaxID=2986947 RepID=UPI0023496700|nr:hypothetical protein [Pseudomonas sp. WJP1]WCM48896.1 hypothetical protein OH720_17920 [Pseudomonas sp. WJP1]
MASSEEQLNVEQVYRSKSTNLSRVPAPNAYDKPTIENTIPGDPDGLMHISKIQGPAAEPIKITVKPWVNLPEDPGDVGHLYLEWKFQGWSDYQPLEDRAILDPASQPNFPGSFEIPKTLYDGYEGTFEVRYRVKEWNTGGEVESFSTPLTFDRTAPWMPAAPPEAIVPKLITTAILEAQGGVECEIPDPGEVKPVTIAIAWSDKIPEQLPPMDEMHYVGLLPADRKIKVLKEVFEDFGSRTLYLAYGAMDKAGNLSQMSWPVTVENALGTLPSGLKSPTVPKGDDNDEIDREDAAAPVEVHTGTIDNYLPEDRIRIIWGTQSFIGGPMSQLGPSPKVIVPWPNMRDAYDFNVGGQQSTPVKFQVLRGNHPIDSPPRVNPLKVDLEVPIVNPGGPDPEHPDFLKPIITSSSGSTTDLTRADADKPATVTVTLPDGIEDNDVITVKWNGELVTATAHTIDGTEGATIDIPVPWEEIKKTPMMLNLPVCFRVKRPGVTNPLDSPAETINVKVLKIELPDPEVQMAGTLVNCNDLLFDGTEWGIHVLIPPSEYLKKDMSVMFVWQLFVDGVGLVNTEIVQEKTVTEEQESNGIYWLVPYLRCLKPSYIPGVRQTTRARLAYGMQIDGDEASSNMIEVRVGVFEEEDHCKIPRP